MEHIVHNEVGPSTATGLSSHSNDTDDDRMIALVLSEEYEKLDGAVSRRLANLASVPVCNCYFFKFSLFLELVVDLLL